MALTVESFPNLETAQAAFQMFDQDLNGDATRDEIEMTCMEIHRERLSLEASMRDLDGAVRRLDDIFLVIVLVVVILVMAAMVVSGDYTYWSPRLTLPDNQAYHSCHVCGNLHPRSLVVDRNYYARDSWRVHLPLCQAPL